MDELYRENQANAIQANVHSIVVNADISCGSRRIERLVIEIRSTGQDCKWTKEFGL